MRTNETSAASDKYSQDIFKNASERYNDSVAANIGKQVCTVNNRSPHQPNRRRFYSHALENLLASIRASDFRGGRTSSSHLPIIFSMHSQGNTGPLALKNFIDETDETKC